MTSFRCGESSRRPAPGFTIIEVAVTVTIIGIIVSVALPAMRDLTVGDTAGPLEPLRVLLVEASRRAAVSGSPVEVWVVPASGRYLMRREVAGSPELQEGVLRLQGVRTEDPADRFRVVFDPVGLGVGDTLAAAGVVLRVEAVTGEVVVER